MLKRQKSMENQAPRSYSKLWQSAILLIVIGVVALALLNRFKDPETVSYGLSSKAAGQSIAAASCSFSDVSAAVTAAASGDTVLVPAGDCAWGSVLIVAKTVTIQGMGVGQTNISRDGTIFILNGAGIVITGFTFSLPVGCVSSGEIIVPHSQNWRVHNNKFRNDCGGSKYAVAPVGGNGYAHPTGVIDHNTFESMRIYISGDIGGSPIGQGGNGIWQQPSRVGSSDQTGVVYIEDNSFTRNGGNIMDCNYGGRYVFRYNQIAGSANIEAHGVQGNNRSCRSWEIYGNNLNASSAWFTAMFLRGGTGVVWGNTITGSYGHAIELDYQRSFRADANYALPPTGPGYCKGLPPENSSWDRNDSGQGGWLCRDQIGAGQDSAGTFPQPQASEPAYFWNNTLNGNAANPFVVNCTDSVKPGGSCADIKVGRDYFNSAKTGYTPYTYPHPLVTASVTPPPTGAQVHYIRAGATGNNSGSDWTNAWSSLSQVQWVRGHTYYIAGGTYVENVTISAAESGTASIILKKANVSENSNDAGWNSTYAATQAVINGFLTINNSYITIDGVTGSGRSGHGIKILKQDGIGGGNAIINFASGKSFLKLSHIELEGPGMGYATGASGFKQNTSSGTSKGLHFSYLYFHGLSQNGFVFVNTAGTSFVDYGLLFENNVLYNNGYNLADAHGQGIQCGSGASATTQSYWIVRNSIMHNNVGTGDFACLGYSRNDHIDIYNNIFYNDNLSFDSGSWVNHQALKDASSPGVIYFSDTSQAADRVRVYNNTFYNIARNTIYFGGTSTNNEVSNNLFQSGYFNLAHVGVTGSYNDYYDSKPIVSSGIYGVPYGETGQQGESSSPVVNAAGGDFRLVSGSNAIGNGRDLSSVFTTDIAGNIRSSWDIGAYEYSTGTTPPPPSPTPTPTPPPTPVTLTISSISVTTAATSATIKWTTNVPSKASVYYGASSNNLNQSVGESSYTTTHTITIPNLTKSSRYYYQIRSANVDGTSTANSSIGNFRTKNK